MSLAAAPRRQSVVFAVLVLGYVLHAAQYGDWLVDDAGITFAYARNIAAGHGPVVNIGEAPVEGYSNPGWTFLVAVLYAVGAFPVPWAPKVVGGALTIVGMWAAWRASRRLGGQESASSAVHLLAPALMALVPTFVKYTMSGLENAMFVLSILAALDAHAQDRRAPGGGSGLLGGLLAFLVVIGRPEGVAYAAVLGLDRVVLAAQSGAWASLGRWLAGLAGPLGLYAAWHGATFEDWLPNTYYAKIAGPRGLAQVLSPHDGGNRYLRTALADHALHGLLLAAALPLVAPRRWLASGGLALYGALGVAMTFPVYAGGDWMPQHRLLSPMYPLLGIAAAAGFAAPFVARLAGQRAPVAPAALAAGALAVTGVTVPSMLEQAVGSRGMRLDVQLGMIDAYGRMADHLGIDHVLLGIADVGGSSMRTTPRFELLDLNGLVTRRVAHLLHALPDTGPEPLRAYVFEERRPHFLNYPEAIVRRYGLDDYPPAREDWWWMDGVDPAGRFGTFVRRDLVEGQVPAELAVTLAASGLGGAARLDGGHLDLWWLPDAAPTAHPQVGLAWLAADGSVLRTDAIRPFSGALGWRILQPGRVLHETWRGTVPEGAVAARLEPAALPAVSDAPPPPAAPATQEAPASVVDGDLTRWTAIPHDAQGWAVESAADGAAVLRVDLAGSGPLVCSPWAPLPPVLHLSGQVRGEAVTRGDKPWKGGGLHLRVKRRDGTQHFPALEQFDGTFEERPFSATYNAQSDDAEVRVCVGATAATGRLYLRGATATAG